MAFDDHPGMVFGERPQHGARLEAVSTLLGHRTLRETSVYAHVGMEELRSVVMRLPLKTGEGRRRGSHAGGDDR